MFSTQTRSSLELMLEKIQEMEDQPQDRPPSLPVRPISKARLPLGRRRSLPMNFQKTDSEETEDENMNPSSRWGVLSKRTMREAFVESTYNQVSAESDDAGSSAIVTLPDESACGRLTRRHFDCMKNKQKPSIKNTKDMSDQDLNNPMTKDHVLIPFKDLVELQRRVLRVEAALRKKEEENAALRLELQKFEQKWSQHEAKMKSMEEMWQDQFTSIQMNLAAAKNGLAAESRIGQVRKVHVSPEHHNHNADNTLSMGSQGAGERCPVNFSDLPHSNGRLNSISHLILQHKNALDGTNLGANSEQIASTMGTNDELQHLKLRFKAWKKDYKFRLRETKATLQKLSHSETEKGRKKWWGS
ncbi:unnamed protein product [Ilex paraguariensis]|uniref:Uncharacterized protein n=1 Tax=Ilex paraguariensis TaxID=185542 RepID=A0ABC8U4W2_9AQUA